MRASALPGRVERALSRWLRRLRRIDQRVVVLRPEGESIGRALFSYVVDPFLLGEAPSISYAHTQDWESWTMARTLCDLGFEVEVIHWTNSRFVPSGPRDLLVDARLNLQRLAAAVGPDCLKVMHAETAHWKVNNDAQLRRLSDLERRRGIRLTRLRLVDENHAIENADCATVLGNDWTLASYRPFGKPLYRVPISNAFEYPPPAGKEIESCRHRFLWFGGVGFVHKGLDRVLEAFAGAPELQLEVAAPIDREADFAAAFARELWQTPNIRTIGWLDVGSSRFREVADHTLGMVFPSCSEGGGGSAITAMHAGLVPIVTYETSVDIEPSFGVLLADAEVPTLRAALRELASRPALELARMATAAWSRARERHTRQAFAANYRRTMVEILERFRPALATRLRTSST